MQTAGVQSDAKAPAPARTEWACLHLPAELAAVGPAAEQLRGWLQARGAADPGALDEVVLATVEALTNAVRHGAKDVRETVRLAWRWHGDELELEVSEPGRFEPAPDWGALPLDPLAEGGRGGFLISRLMDAVEHRNASGRHALHLRKRMVTRPPMPGLEAGAALAEAEATLEAMTEELGNSYEVIAALFHFAKSLGTATTLQALAEKSFERLRPLAEASAVWVRLARSDGTLALLAQSGGGPAPAELPAGATACEVEVARHGVERTLARRATLPAADPLSAGQGCAFLCPFTFEGRLRGVLTVVRDRDDDGFFTAGQLGLARTLADFMGIACGNADLQEERQSAERAERELELAEQIQRALLPSRIPGHPGWLVHGVCAQAAEVGGDFFDVFDLPQGGRLVVIADVMGKGVPAALLAATLRTAVRAHAASQADPGKLFDLVNRQLCEDLQHLEMFITAQVLHLDATGRRLALASAGHCPVLVMSATGEATWLEEGGLPLGLSATENYQSTVIAVPPTARVLLMTDGLLEHEDGQARQLGTDGAAALLRTVMRRPVSAVGPALLEALQARSENRPPRDDCTLVTITSTLGGPK